jgi:hypothetical protein
VGAIPGKLRDSGIYTFARTVAYQIANVYAIRMAAVFMMSTRTLAIRMQENRIHAYPMKAGANSSDRVQKILPYVAF